MLFRIYRKLRCRILGTFEQRQVDLALFADIKPVTPYTYKKERKEKKSPPSQPERMLHLLS